jgi:ribonuclease BN (tRNA processing enzyme)
MAKRWASTAKCNTIFAVRQSNRTYRDHTPVEEVGRIAQEAGVKTLVLSHLTPAIDSITDDEWRTPAAKYFKGEIIVGKDLMVV